MASGSQPPNIRLDVTVVGAPAGVYEYRHESFVTAALKQATRRVPSRGSPLSEEAGDRSSTGASEVPERSHASQGLRSHPSQSSRERSAFNIAHEEEGHAGAGC